MLKIRLQRVGRKHDPSYRVILTDVRRGPKSGKFIENLGFYDARKDLRQIKGEKVKYWIEKGAQVSDTVHNILITEKIITGKKINVLPKKTPIVKETFKEEITQSELGEVVSETAEEVVTESNTESNSEKITELQGKSTEVEKDPSEKTGVSE